MPIINNNAVAFEPVDGRRARRFVGKEAGAVNLTVNELIMGPNSALRLHTHPTDEAIVLLEGNVEMEVGGESKNVTPGHTLLAPPNTPHRLINHTDADARMYTIFPTDNPTTTFVD